MDMVRSVHMASSWMPMIVLDAERLNDRVNLSMSLAAYTTLYTTRRSGRCWIGASNSTSFSSFMAMDKSLVLRRKSVRPQRALGVSI